jgi:general secretion pathway protein L
MAAKVQDSELWPEMVLLTGGGSLIHGLAAALEDTLGIQVRCLGELEGLGSLAQFQDHSTEPAVFSVAAALAFRGPGRRFGFNFQAEEILSQNPLVKWRRQLTYALVACALVAFSWLGSVAVNIYTKKQTLDRLELNIEEVFHRTVPEFQGSVRSSQYASIVKNKINQLNQSVSLFGTDIGHHSTVELLRIVSAAVPQDLDVTLNLLTVDSHRLRLSGRADGFNTVDGVKNRLMALDQFDRVTITGAKAAADGQGVQFGLELLRQQLSGESS